MTALIQIHSTNLPANLAKAVLYMQSAAAAAIATLAKPAAGNNPAIPALTVSRGAVGFRDSYQLIATSANETRVLAEVPYSTRQYAQSLNLRAAILPVVGAVNPAFTGAPSATPAPNSPANLETYLYDCAVAAGAKIQAITKDGVSKIVIEAVFPQSIATLLAPSGGGGEQ
jgi:hypothetical protein